VQYEAQKQRFDDTRQPQPRPQPQRQVTIDDALANMPGLYGSEIDWLKAHPELVLDQAKNKRLVVYFDEAVERGLERGSPQFAQYLESRLGIANHGGYTSTRRDHAEPNYAAPVTRNGSGLDLDPSEMRGRVTLSPSQIEAARMAGISLDEYARQVLVLQARKRMGDYQ
jgi:hypothetical protein